MYDSTRVNIVDRREMLRVKLKSLVAEAKIIRREEHRTYGALRDELALHRRTVVRFEARCTHLAYGLIRGRTIDQMEPKRLVEHNTALKEKVAKMVQKYGPQVQLKKVA